MAGEANVWNPRTLLSLSADTKRVEERFTATAGQTLFTLTDFVYAPNTGALAVYKNGLYQTKGVDWTEGTDTTFSLVSATVAGDQVVAVGHVAITANVDVRDTDIFVSNYQAIRDYGGTEITLYSQGQATNGDGGEAFFQKRTGAAPGTYVDDNTSVIVPTGGDGSVGWTRKNQKVTESTVALMKVNTSLVSGDSVETLGYYDGWAAFARPRGGAKYTIATLAQVRTQKGDPTWVPDEKLDHTLDNANVAMFDTLDEINVLQAGARVDDATDDYASVFAAVQTGLPLTFPKGTCRIGTAIDYNALKVAGNTIMDIIWKGEGMFDTIVKYTGAGTFLIAGDTSGTYYPPGMHMKDISFFGTGNLGHTSTSIGGYTTTTSANAGNDSTQRGFLLSASGLYPSSCENVRWKFWNLAVEMDQLYYGMKFNSCLFQSNNIGWKPGNNTTACTASRTEFAGNAVGVYFFGSNQNISLLDCVMQANTAGAGVLTNAGESITIKRCYWTGNVNDFIHVGNNTISNPGGGILNGLYFDGSFGGSVNLGDNVRHVFIDASQPSSFGILAITNNYTQQIAGVIRRVRVGTQCYDVNVGNFMNPFVDFDGGQADEIIHGTAGTRVYNSVAQSIPTGVTTTLTFNTERWDDESYHDLVTNTSRLTVDRPAKYVIDVTVPIATNGTGQRFVHILKNGTDVIAKHAQPPVAAATTYINVSVTENLSETDYVEVQVFQDSGIALDVISVANARPEFGIHMLN